MGLETTFLFRYNEVEKDYVNGYQERKMSTNSLQENKMGVMPEERLLLNMALPMIVSMLVQALYNVVDSIFVSQVSESAVTALSLAFPIQNLQIGFAVGIGVGVNSLLSKSLGEGNQEAANRTAGNGFILMLIVTALFMLFGVIGVRPYYEMQSTVRETVEGGIVYSQICCLLTVGVFLSILGERLLQATGRTVYTMITQSTGAILNIILDPILIHGWFGAPAMGIAGAAVATVIGQWVSAALVWFFNFRFNPEVQFGARYLRLEGKTVRQILVVGVPSIVMNGIGSVMTFGMNQILQNFTETATGVFGVYFKLQSFFFMPVFGLNNGITPIIAYNYGAQKRKRMIHTIKLSMTVAFCLTFIGFLLFETIPQTLLGLFNASDNLLAIGVPALRIIGFHYLIAWFCIIAGTVFQALGKAVFSMIVSIMRQLFVLIPAAYILAKIGGLHMVWWSFPIAELISFAVSLTFLIRIYRTIIQKIPEEA